MSTLGRHLDTRSGLVLDTRDLGRRPGALREVRDRVSAPAGLATDVIGVGEGSPVELDLRLQSVVEGVLVSGEARLTATGQCGRCLEPISVPLAVQVQELYCYDGNETDDDASRLVGDLLDLEPLIRDEVLVELPFQPVCRDDCAGLCPRCGASLNDDPAHEHGGGVDPRWAELADWRSQPDAADN